MTDLRSAPVPPVTGADHVRGPSGAPAVVLYADFTCPRCAVAWVRLRDAPLRVVFRHLALKAKHPRAVALALASEAAGQQGAFWAFADAVYADPGRIDDPHLWAHVEALGLDVEAFERDRRSDAAADRVQQDVRAALRAGATVTPTLFGPDGARHAGPPDAATVAGWVQQGKPAANGPVPPII